MYVVFVKYHGQYTIDFSSDVPYDLIPIETYKDIIKSNNGCSKKKVKKFSLSVIDMITSSMTSSELFQKVRIKTQIYDDFIGTIYKNWMYRLPIIFDDSRLFEIASNLNGSNISFDNRTAEEEYFEIQDLVAKDRDFITYVERESDYDGVYISNSLISSMYNYNLAFKEANDFENIEYNELVRACDDSRLTFLKNAKSYKNFRTLYAFKKKYYEFKKTIEKKENKKLVENSSEPKQKTKENDQYYQLNMFRDI